MRSLREPDLSRLRSIALPILVGVAGLVATMWIPLASGFARVHADEGDARHLNYVLEHVHRWVTGDPAHRELFSPPVFYPARNTGAYSEILAGAFPLYTPFRLAGAPPDVALQLFTLTALVTTFAAGYALYRRGFELGVPGASAAAYLFAFGAWRAQKIGHHHLLAHGFTALALLAAVEAFRTPEASRSRRRAWIALLFGSLVGQAWTGVYLAWFLGFALAVAGLLALSLAATRRPLLAFLRAEAPALAAAALLSALAVLPLARPYLAAAQAVGMRSYDLTAQFLPPLKAWVNPGPHSLVYGDWLGEWGVVRELPFSWEKALFPGFLTGTLLLAGLSAGWRRTPVRMTVLTAGAVVLLATSWPGGHSLWRLVFETVPSAGAIRAVPRFSLLLLIPAGAALGYALDAFRARHGSRAAAGLALLVAVEQVQEMPAYDRARPQERVARVAAAVPPGCPAFFYSPVLSPQAHWVTQLDGMWASLETGVPTVNGYSSNLAPGWTPLMAHVVRLPGQRRVHDDLAVWEKANGLTEGSVCVVRLAGWEPFTRRVPPGEPLPAAPGVATGSSR